MAKKQANPKKPRKTKRATPEEREERIRYVMRLRCEGFDRQDLLPRLMREWDLSEVMVDHYWVWAKERLFQIATGRSPQEWRGMSIMFWESIKNGTVTCAKGEEITLKDRMKAQDKLDFITGVKPMSAAGGGNTINLSQTNNVQINQGEAARSAFEQRLRELPDDKLAEFERLTGSLLGVRDDSQSPGNQEPPRVLEASVASPRTGE